MSEQGVTLRMRPTRRGGAVDKPIVLDAEPEVKEVISGGWLWFIALVGCLLVVLSILLALINPEVNSIWSDVVLQFGSTILLFSVLFYVERHFVRREVRQFSEQLLRALRRDEAIPEDILNDPDTNLNSNASIAASKWYSAVASGNFTAAWAMSEENWRMCRAQAWIWNNKTLLNLTDLREMQNLAEELSKVQSEHPLWPTFIDIERNQFQESTASAPPDRWGIATRRRCVGPGYELFLFLPLSDEYRHGLEVRAPTLISGSQSVLMHFTGNDWLLAAFGAEAAPLPGWPPAWWIKYDPVAEAATDQMESA